MHNRIQPSLDPATADFNNVGEVIGMATRLIAEANRLGFFLGSESRQSREAMRLVADAVAWVTAVKKRLDACSPGEALSLTDIFDLIHRVAFRRPADRVFINAIILRAFEARIHGDRTVDEQALYRAIRSAVSRKDSAFLGRPLQWLCLCEQPWPGEATPAYNRATPAFFHSHP